jgi:hypothetical protein
LIMVMVSPASCFACGMIMLGARRQVRLSRLQRCALLAALLPVTLGTVLAVWTVKLLFLMCGIGT